MRLKKQNIIIHAIYFAIPEIYSVIPEIYSVIPEIYSVIPEIYSVIPEIYSVIPAKAGIQCLSTPTPLDSCLRRSDEFFFKLKTKNIFPAPKSV